MSSFAERFGRLTVAQVLELNNKAKETCEWELTSQVKEDNNARQYNRWP